MIPELSFIFEFAYWAQESRKRKAVWNVEFKPMPDQATKELIINIASRIQRITRSRFWLLYVTVCGEKNYRDWNRLEPVRMPVGRDAIERYLTGLFDRLDQEAEITTRD